MTIENGVAYTLGWSGDLPSDMQWLVTLNKTYDIYTAKTRRGNYIVVFHNYSFGVAQVGGTKSHWYGFSDAKAVADAVLAFEKSEGIR